MRVTTLGRADVLKVLAMCDASEHARVLKFFGFAAVEAKPQPVTVEQGLASASQQDEPLPVFSQATPLAAVPFWQPISCKRREAEADPHRVPNVCPTWTNAPTERPLFRVLSPWRELLPRLRLAVAADLPTMSVDVDRVVAALSLGRTVDPLPRETARRLSADLHVVIDRSDRLVPFWDDQDLILATLRAQMPGHRLSVGVFHEALSEPWPIADDTNVPRFELPSPGTTVLVLGDLGCLEHGVSLAVPTRV